MIPDHGGCPSSELDLAKSIQQLLFPKNSPTCSWCCIGVKNRMAEGLGGDYYEFITMPDSCQTILLGDVTGHGIHASIVMSLIYGFIHRATQGECSPVALVRQVNDLLTSFAARSNILDQYFSSTLFFGIIDPQSLEMAYVNAGHPSPLIQRAGTMQELYPTAQPIGFFTDMDINLGRFQFTKGDRLLLYTDGIVEGANPSGELFGNDRLKEVLQSGSNDYLEFLDSLFAELHRFEANEPPADDCTAIVIDFHGGFASQD